MIFDEGLNWRKDCSISAYVVCYVRSAFIFLIAASDAAVTAASVPPVDSEPRHLAAGPPTTQRQWTKASSIWTASNSNRSVCQFLLMSVVYSQKGSRDYEYS